MWQLTVSPKSFEWHSEQKGIQSLQESHWPERYFEFGTSVSSSHLAMNSSAMGKKVYSSFSSTNDESTQSLESQSKWNPSLHLMHLS